MTAPLSREAIARFLVRPDRPRVAHRKVAKPAAVGPSNPIRLAAEFFGRFTAHDLAKATGRSPHNCRTTLCLMRRQGLVRKVASQSQPVALYERLPGGDMSGRVRNDGAKLIEAMPVGHTFTRADIPGTVSQVNLAIYQARKCGLIRRISPRQTHAVWEVAK